MTFRQGAAALGAAVMMAMWTASAAAQLRAPQTPQYIVADRPAGVNLYVPGKWGVIALGVINPTDQPAEVLAALHFDGDPSLQYGRQFWLPPRSRRATWYPLLTPAVPKDRTRAAVKALLIDRTHEREQFIESRSGEMFQPGLLTVEQESPVTGIFADPDDADPRNALIAARLGRDMSWRLAGLRGDTPPVSVETLGALDQLAISSDAVAADGALLLAIRRWVFDGGQVWLMLDELDPETARRLLGDLFQVQVVDRVDLTEFQMEGRRPNGQVWQGELRQFDEPVPFVRVLAPNVEVSHTINGWPAAFSQQVGSGRILYTTLGARGWTRPRTEQDQKAEKSLRNAPAIATEALSQLTTEFLEPRRPARLAPQALENYAADQIGYSIVGRKWIIATLGGFCGVVLGLGVWLQRRGRLELLGWIGPLAAVGVTIVLGWVGTQSRRAVPTTAALAEFAEVVPGSDDLHLTGAMALYHQDQSAAEIGARRGGVFWPDMTGQAGSTRRMVWTDLDAWHWENLTLPAGVRLAKFNYTAKMPAPLSARAKFTADGLVGELAPGPFQNASDALLATSARRGMTVQLLPEGKFRTTPQDVLPPGQVLGGATLDDQQRQRQAVYQQLFDRPNDAAYPSRPTLFFWAAPLDPNFALAPDAQQTGAALVALPLELERSAPGEVFTLPAPFLPFQSVPGPGRVGMSAAYQNREGKWIGPLVEGAETFLRFQVPPELLPLELQKATLTIKLTAPGRTLELLAANDKSTPVLEQRSSPLGVQTFQLTQPESLQLDAQGGLLLGLRIGTVQDASGSISSSGWKIDYVQLEAVGVAR